MLAARSQIYFFFTIKKTKTKKQTNKKQTKKLRNWLASNYPKTLERAYRDRRVSCSSPSLCMVGLAVINRIADRCRSSPLSWVALWFQPLWFQRLFLDAWMARFEILHRKSRSLVTRTFPARSLRRRSCADLPESSRWPIRRRK